MISVAVASVNDFPTAEPFSLSVYEDVPSSLRLIGSDVEGDPLQYEFTSLPSLGALSGDGDQWLYTPDLNVNGNDQFSYTVFDGELISPVVTVNISIASVNDAPYGQDLALMGNEDMALQVDVVTNDVDGDQLNYTIIRYPTHGTLSGDAPRWVYAPNLDFNGSDTFSYTVSDGVLSSQPIEVSIDVAPVNDPPKAQSRILSLMRILRALLSYMVWTLMAIQLNTRLLGRLRMDLYD